MNSSNIITSVLHLKEASDLLVNDEPEISYTLLQLSKVILDSHQISDNEITEAEDISKEISENTNITQETTNEQ